MREDSSRNYYRFKIQVSNGDFKSLWIKMTCGRENFKGKLNFLSKKWKKKDNCSLHKRLSFSLYLRDARWEVLLYLCRKLSYIFGGYSNSVRYCFYILFSNFFIVIQSVTFCTWLKWSIFPNKVNTLNCLKPCLRFIRSDVFYAGHASIDYDFKKQGKDKIFIYIRCTTNLGHLSK